MDIKIIYEDDDLLVVDKPAGIVVFEEGKNPSASSWPFLINELIKRYPDLNNAGEEPRYGVVHRLDKDTSGILLVAKSTEALIFLQKQFSAHTFSSINKERENWDISTREHSDTRGKNRESLEKNIEKRYIALATGNIKDDKGVIETLIGRSPQDPRKQKSYPLDEADKTGLRGAISEYKVLERFENYTLLEVEIKTGRKHQIRCHLSYIHHPIAGDKMYGFKDSPTPEGLDRQFLHATYLKIKLPNGEFKEFKSDLPEELQKIINNLEKII